MQWRRGILLAAIHLAVAGSLIVWQEFREMRQSQGVLRLQAHASLHFVAFQEQESAFPFDPCKGGFVDYWITPEENIVQFANPAAVAIAGWIRPCPMSWTLAGVLCRFFPSNNWKREIETAAGLVVLVPLQWLLIGGFPLIQPRRWWLEPGAIITLCVFASCLLLPIQAIQGKYELSLAPLFIASLAWIWWFCLLVWKTCRAGWRLAARQIARTS